MAFVGIVGFSGGKFDEDKASKIIDEIFSQLNRNDVIVSGGTALGIPLMAYNKAKSLGMETIGIMCSKGFEYDVFDVDKMIVVGDDWGDESKEFLSSIEILYRIGGGKQSFEEVKEAKKMGIDVHEFDLDRIE